MILLKNKKIIFCIIIIILDQLVKFLINSNISLEKEIFVIPNFFYLTNLLNTGGAFSIFEGNSIILGIIGIIFLLILVKYLNNKKLKPLEEISYGILIGGIISNLIDRIYLNGVRDYIGLKFGNYYYPVFNIADIGIVIGIILIIILELKGDSNGNRSN